MTSAKGPTTRDLFFKTPLIDLVRGRVTARLDSESRMESLALPESLRAHIRDVVRRTRLWRTEKADLTCELASHFADGIDSGRTAEDLVASFGEPAIAAKLLSRAKRRNRPLAWRALVRTLQSIAALLALCTGAWLVAAAIYFTRSPTISRNFAAELSAAPLATVDSPAAWPTYLDAIELLDRAVPDGNDPALEMANPTWSTWSRALTTIDRAQEGLALAREAASRPRLGLPLSNRTDDRLYALLGKRTTRTLPTAFLPEQPALDANPPLISVYLAHLGEFRRIARLLATDTRRAIAACEAARVIDNLRALRGLARHCRQPDVLIGQFTAQGVATLELNLTREALFASPPILSERQLIALAHSLAGMTDASLTINYTTEMAMFDDALQRCFTDDGAGDGVLTPEGLRMLLQFVGQSEWPPYFNPAVTPSAHLAARAIMGPIGMSVLAGRRENRDHYSALLARATALAETPWWQRTPDSLESIRRTFDSKLHNARFPMVALFMPGISRAADVGERARQERDGAIVAVALELHRLRTGAYPATLHDLVPAMLPEIPPDRFDGRPLRFAPREDKPIVYSIGSDNTDDGGVLPPGVARTAPAAWRSSPDARPPIVNADWILYPLDPDPEPQRQ